MSSVTTQRLAEIPLFSNMDDEERSELHSLMTERIFQPGQVVMKAGEEQATISSSFVLGVISLASILYCAAQKKY